MESDHEDIDSLKMKSAQQDQHKPLSSQPINELPHLLKRAHLIPMDSHNLIWCINASCNTIVEQIGKI